MSTASGPYDWAKDKGWGPSQGRPSSTPPRNGAATGAAGAGGGRTRTTNRSKTFNINVGNVGVSGTGAGGGRGGAFAGGADRHQGDRLIYAIERIEFRGTSDIMALAKAINHLGRELHLILGMRAEELNGVLSQYKGKWYHFGTSSRVKARLVSAHLKVSAEAARALGVGALKMAHAYTRHFVLPEQEARQQKQGGQRPRRQFSVVEDGER
ncbi:MULTISPECIES: hypothetical protein [Streptomyces]|uniref:hypothetical protein n=1 Tax=Streptomyces TaxID=1883 RepID=UPI00163C08C4|nr:MULTISPECIES: hypothetical protein [Streptomyces]MBC2879791.1 hypothetical protein [Streptomyces sp. TYQ1024]UBI41397.1 hypothetical protein K7I03_33575 [Streptomyces mobaraensis]